MIGGAYLYNDRPADDHGVPLGVGDWRYAVEMGLPDPAGGLWGEGLWSEALWGRLVWTDITQRCRGASWQDGASAPYSRPETGVLTLTLDNKAHDWDPWNPGADGSGYFTAGALVRVVVFRPGTGTTPWIPQFTGIVEDWVPERRGGAATGDVTVTAVATTAELAEIDERALPGLVGGGETPAQRIRRLLADAEASFPFLAEYDPAVQLQSTDMAGNRLGECHLTADSCDGLFMSHRSGCYLLVHAAAFERVHLAPGDWSTNRPVQLLYQGLEFVNGDPGPRDGDPGGLPVGRVAFAVDSIRTPNDKLVVLNDVRLARKDGTQQVAIDAASRSKYGTGSYARSDLLNLNDADVEAIAQNIVLRRSQVVLRVSELSADGRLGDANPNLPLLAAITVGDTCVVERPGVGHVRIPAAVDGYRHDVAPMGANRVQWRSTFTFSTFPFDLDEPETWTEGLTDDDGVPLTDDDAYPLPDDFLIGV